MRQHLYFFLSIVAISIGVVGILSSYNGSFIFAGDGSDGDPYTVCEVGCDYTTIQDAVSTIAADSFVRVEDSYNSSTESWPIGFNNLNITLTCESGAVIGPTSTNSQGNINLSEGSTISGCTMNGSQNDNASGGMGLIVEDPDVTIEENSTTDVYVQVNTSTATGLTVHNNTMIMESASTTMINFYAGDITISSNTLSYEYSGTITDAAIIFENGTLPADNVLVVSNTMYMTADTINGRVLQYDNGGVNQVFRGNRVSYAGNGENLLVFSENSIKENTEQVITHNTFLLSDYSFNEDRNLFKFVDSSDNAKTVSVTSTFNVFYYDGTGSTSSVDAYYIAYSQAGSFFEDYNAYIGNWGDVTNSEPDEGTFVENGNSIVGNGIPLRLNDADSSNDFELVPYSRLLDVQGTTDIGAIAAVREAVFTIDDDCTIDYSSCHATSSLVMAQNIVSGDTWNFSDGIYAPLTLTTSTYATSSITLIGSGSGTLFQGTANRPYGVQVQGLSNVTTTDFVVEGVTTSESNYFGSHMIFDFGGNTYDQTSVLGLGDESTIYTLGTDCSGGDSFGIYSVDNTDLSAVVGDATEDFNIVLATVFGQRVTYLIRADQFANPAALDDACDAIEEGNEAQFVVDAWVTSTFAVADGVYTYDSSAIAAAGLSVSAGYTSPPTITRNETIAAGLRIIDTGTVVIQNVTSTDNTNGIDIDNTNGVITMSTATIQNSTNYDVVVSDEEDHVFNNVVFTVASSSIVDNASVTVNYTTRALIQDESDDPISGVAVTFEDTATNTTTLTTNGAGYTNYTLLPAFVLTNGNMLVTSGGYNPYTVTAAATSTYSSSSTMSTLYQRNQTFMLALAEAASAPDAPTGLTTTTVATSSITLTWNDNSDNEENFIVDFVASSSATAFPGTTSTVAANSSEVTLSGLSPNTEYLVRIAAINSEGTSAYATSSVITTDPTPVTEPDAPSDIATSTVATSSIGITWNDNSDNEDNFIVDYVASSSVAAFPGTTSSIAANSTNVTLAGLSHNTVYRVRVAAENGEGTSAYATSSVVVTAAIAPTTFTATTLSSTSIQLAWNDVNGTQYKVYQDGVLISSTALTSSTASGLTCNTAYTFTVRAVNQLDELSPDAATDTATTSTCSEEDEEETPRRGGGGAYIPPSTPVLPSNVDALNALKINDGDRSTNSRTVTLHIEASNVVEMAISNSSDFTAVSYIPFTSAASHVLTPGNGEKRVYVKLRSQSGGTLTVTDTIELRSQVTEQATTPDQDQASCTLTTRTPYQIDQDGELAVYYVTDDCTRRTFSNAAVYYSYYTGWQAVVRVDRRTLESIPMDPVATFMPWGPRYNPASGTLIKTLTDAKVYLLLNGSIYDIEDEAAARYHFGTAWSSWIIDVSPDLLATYQLSDMVLVDDGERPSGLLITYANSPDVYRLDIFNGTLVKRWIANITVFRALNFRDDRIVTIPAAETYPDGKDIQ